jgi:methylamine--corrinoid protein Co-methyltransferase
MEIIERARSGPVYTQKNYDLKVMMPRLNEVVRQYGISYDPNNVVNSDDRLADDVFKAAYDFFLDIGVYCLDTQRVIKFGEEEIKEALKSTPSGVTFGLGREAKIFNPRKPESRVPPWFFLGACGAPVSNEEIMTSLVKGYASIPMIDSITTPPISTIEGMGIRSGDPSEIYGCIRAAVLVRDALRRAGKPGLPVMNTLSTSQLAASRIAVAYPNFGLSPMDGWLVAALPGMKVDYERLKMIVFLLEYGGRIGTLYGGTVCDYTGPAGSAVLQTAYFFLASLVMKTTYHTGWTFHAKKSCGTDRESLWITSLMVQAISRNTNAMYLHPFFTASGPLTEMCYQETAAGTITIVSSGGGLGAVAPAHGSLEDHQTPLEPKFASEVAISVLGMKRADANDLVKHLLGMYEDKIKTAPEGKKYQDCFNLATGKPCREAVELYQKMKKNMSELGLNL